jgi:Na+-translocating ferredoxin:NAD+ oxidoreductase RnfG subunit
VAKTYLSLEEAQQVIFPGKYFTKVKFEISKEIHQKLKKISGIHHPLKANKFWLAVDGSWFIVDEVVGKHEMITYALGINADGKIQEIQVLQYNETYGHEIREESWRSQFVNKSANDEIRLNKDIVNISGATLSSKHVTDGVRRLMALHSLLLRKLNIHAPM